MVFSETSSTARAVSSADNTAFKEVVLAALARQPQPIAISRLRSSLPPPFRGKPAAFKPQLDSLVASGCIWFFPSGKPEQPLVWGRSPASYVESLLLAALTKKPLSRREVETKTNAKLKHLSPADRHHIFDKLIADGRVFPWPKKPGTKTEKFGSTPPAPREYLESALKALSKAVAKVAAAFSDVGIDPSETHAAALAAIHSEPWALQAAGKQKPAMHSAPPPDDETLLGLIADHMAAIDPRSRRGAPVLIADLRPAVAFLFPTPIQFDAALIRLERAGRVSLLRYDPALAAEPLAPSRLVTDGHKTYSGVSLR
jgi:hypothetical protein